jgi:hypothetical protein
MSRDPSERSDFGVRTIIFEVSKLLLGNDGYPKMDRKFGSTSSKHMTAKFSPFLSLARLASECCNGSAVSRY